MPKKYIVRLSDTERHHLQEVIKRLQGTPQKVRRAQILFKADANGPDWTDQRIAEAYGCRINTVENIRQRFVEEGFERALEGRKRECPPTPRLLDGGTGSAHYRHALGIAAGRLCALEPAAVGRASRRVGDYRFHQP